MQLEVPVTSSGPSAYVEVGLAQWHEAYTPYSGSVPADSEAQVVTVFISHCRARYQYVLPLRGRGVQGVSVSFWPFNERAFESGVVWQESERILRAPGPQAERNILVNSESMMPVCGKRTEQRCRDLGH